MTDIETQHQGGMPIHGRGRIPSWQGDEQCDSVGLREEAEGAFQQRLINIDEEMGLDDLQGLKFLCVDYIPVSKLESAKSPLDIFTHMRKGQLIDVDNIDFLLECLGRMHRFDLVKKLDCDPDELKANIDRLEKVTPYRRLCMSLAEDMDDKDLGKMKFYVQDYVRKNKLSGAQTIFDLFIVMEQEQLISSEKPEALAEIMRSISRPDLLSIVNKFTGVATVNPEPVFPRPAVPNNPPAQHPANVGARPPLYGEANYFPGSGMQRRELNVGSGSSPRPTPIDRSASAGTLIVSESESSLEDVARGGADLVPPALLGQVCDEVKHQFNELGFELGFSNDDIEEYNDRYRDSLERTKKMLREWQERKVDKKQIGPGLRYAFGKLGQKTADAAIKEWMESRYPSMSLSEGQRAPNQAQAANQRPPPGHEVNYTSSMNEARPGGGDLPIPAGPPGNMYQTQGHGNSENVCMSVREAQPWRSDPGAIDPATQDENMLQIVNQMRNINISGQLTPQQMVSQYRQILAPMTQMDPQVQMQGNQPTAPQLVGPAAPVAHAQGTRPASLEPERDAMLSTLPEYRMNRRPRGWCVIINNRDFTVQRDDRDAKEMPKRTGTDKDAESLQHVFEKLGFIVNRRDNQSDSEMLRFLVDIAHNVDHSLFDCLVVCILTHGIENYVYGSNGRYISIKDITGTFQANRCPNLAGKPKLFFIQACQGRNKMEGNQVDRDAGDIEKDAVPPGQNKPRHQISIETDEVQKEMIPNEADFLIGYATVPGFVSFRSRNNGSWYIRKLCQLLDKFSDRHDLLSILVEVNREVSHANAQIDGGIFKQTPAPLVTLRKKLYFR